MPTTPTFVATVMVTAGPDPPTIWVHLIGDVDLSADPDLAAIVERLIRARPQTVCIDLGGVTFAGTALVSFLVRAKAACDSDAPLVLWRAPPTVRLILDAVGLDSIVVLAESDATAPLSRA